MTSWSRLTALPVVDEDVDDVADNARTVFEVVRKILLIRHCTFLSQSTILFLGVKHQLTYLLTYSLTYYSFIYSVTTVSNSNLRVPSHAKKERLQIVIR